MKSYKKKDFLYFNKVDINWNFSKKPIIQIDVVPGNNLLFALSDNLISVHNLNQKSFPVIHVEPRTKGAHMFVLDAINLNSQTNKITVFIRVCVAVRRTLQFYFWKNSVLETFASDIQLTDVPKTFTWIENTICIGFKADYVLYNVSGEKIELFPTSSSRNIDPFVTTLSDKADGNKWEGKIFGVTKDDAIIAVDPYNSKNDSVKKKTENETKLKNFKTLTLHCGTARYFIYDEPYIVALINNDVEVHVLERSGPKHETIIQILKNFDNPHLVKRVSQGLILCASTTKLWGIKMVDIVKQRKQILKSRRFELAVHLIVS